MLLFYVLNSLCYQILCLGLASPSPLLPFPIRRINLGNVRSNSVVNYLKLRRAGTQIPRYLLPFLLGLREYAVAHPVCGRTARFWKRIQNPIFCVGRSSKQCLPHRYWEENLVLPSVVLTLVIWPVVSLLHALGELVFSSRGSLSNIPFLSPPPPSLWSHSQYWPLEHSSQQPCA